MSARKHCRMDIAMGGGYLAFDAACRTQRSDQRENPRDLRGQDRGLRPRAVRGNRAALRCASSDCDGTDRGDVARGDRSARAANPARHEPRGWGARRLESRAGKNRGRLRLHVAMRPIFRPRCFALDRFRHTRIGIQTLDNVKSAARIFAPASRRIARGKSGRRSFPPDAGKRNFHSGRRARPAQDDRARKQG